MAKTGPFFYIKSRLIFNACDLSEGRIQGDKIDNSYGHDTLWDDNFKTGEYIDHPRGRVIWDSVNNRAIIYIDRCINKPQVIQKIKTAFEFNNFIIEYDDHYRCRRCIGDIFAD